MEIQGLSEAQNIHSQHGALHMAPPPALQSVSGSLCPFISMEREAERRLEAAAPQSDSNNNAGPKTAFRLLEENGSYGAASCASRAASELPGGLSDSRGLLEIRNIIYSDKETVLNALLSQHGLKRTGWKSEDRGSAGLSLLEEEDARRPSGGLRQQREDGTQDRVLVEGQRGHRLDNCTAEFYVVFNNAQKDGAKDAHVAAPDGSSDGERPAKERRRGSMEVCKSSDAAFGLFSDNCPSLNVKPIRCHHMAEDGVLTNKHGEKICGQKCSENGEDRLFRGLARAEHGQPFILEADKTELGLNLRGLPDPLAPLATSTSPASNETFSGTITIDNQSIIVTIENGLLTLAAPPNPHVHRDGDTLNLKEHLGMKENEDIVLLNYESGSKSTGKMSSLELSGLSPKVDSRPAMSLTGSDMALVDDCPLAELGAAVDSCPVVKREGVIEAEMISPTSKASVTACDVEDLVSLHFVKPKKENVCFSCTEPGCCCTFDSRQKLKVHLLNHAEEPRPYQCTVEGCGWAFSTSYKLKRHLQSHEKQRPYTCQFEGCGRSFTTVYNLKAHVKVHELDDAFVCEVCSEKFRSATRLSSHQRIHFEPQRPHKCEFPGCEKTFITFSALFSHNRTHFREAGQFTCTYPGCDKTYDKACRLKIHMRSHTGERPFVCDSEGCGWSFTSMSKLLRHKRKHDDDRRFVCSEEGCGKSFTRAEHLKGHSITHLGTKPFQCFAEGCSAKFSARSSLYIHSKKHKQDAGTLRAQCPVDNCSKYYFSKSSLKSHILKHHHMNQEVLSQMETTPTLTPSSELISSTLPSVSEPGVGGEQLTSLELSSLFSSVPGGGAPPAADIGVGLPLVRNGSNTTFSLDLPLVNSGVVTIDASSVGTALVKGKSAVAKPLDPLSLQAHADMAHQQVLVETVTDVLSSPAALNLEDVPSVSSEAVGTVASLSISSAGSSVDPSMQHPLSSMKLDSSLSLVMPPVAELLASPCKVVEMAAQGGAGPLLSCVEVLGPQEGGKVLTQYVFPSPTSNLSPQKEPERAASPCNFLESGGSARTDYRAIQLAKKRKQIGSPVSCQRKAKGTAPLPSSNNPYCEGPIANSGGLTLRDHVMGVQYVQIQLLQDDAAPDGELAFQLSPQHSSPHAQLTVDLPVHILQEPSVMTEDNGSDNSQFTGSTINLQDLE